MEYQTVSAETQVRIERLRAQAEALTAVIEPNLFHHSTANAIIDLDSAGLVPDERQLGMFLDVIEDELSVAQRASDRHAAQLPVIPGE